MSQPSDEAMDAGYESFVDRETFEAEVQKHTNHEWHIGWHLKHREYPLPCYGCLPDRMSRTQHRTEAK